MHYLTYREPERSRITRFIVKYYRTFYRRDSEGAVLATAIAMTMLGAFLAIAAFVQIGAGVFWSFLVSLFGQVE